MTGAIPAIPIESSPPEGFHSGFGERNRTAEVMQPRSNNRSLIQSSHGDIKDRILFLSQP